MTRYGRLSVAKVEPEMFQYLTITLGKESFALPIDQVREIIEFSNLTQIPLTPPFLRGVINLRGAVVPVIDLQIRFGRTETHIHKRSCIVIIEGFHDSDVYILGLLVDAVNEVTTIEKSLVEPRPMFGTDLRSDFIMGLVHRDDHFMIALDIGQILSIDEMSKLIELSSVSTDS